jgi:hypothetical protein
MNISVADVINQTPLNIGLTRVLLLRDAGWERWLHLVELLMGVHLNDEQDKFTWHLSASGIYSVKSYYAEYMRGHI